MKFDGSLRTSVGAGDGVDGMGSFLGAVDCWRRGAKVRDRRVAQE